MYVFERKTSMSGQPGDGDPQRKLGQAHFDSAAPGQLLLAHDQSQQAGAIVLDLKTTGGRAAFDRLVPTVDVMVVNFPLKVRERLEMRRCRAPSRRQIGLSFTLEPVTPGAGPGHGQHTDEVLGEVGYSTAEIAGLRDTGALG